jgi:hypothetical protein
MYRTTLRRGVSDALYKYLQNRRNREQGINFGVSGGVGAGEGRKSNFIGNYGAKQE